ncbi:MAG: MFS transporter [Burkholderiales bacterium]|nr:MFS transporter [Burkholderiales bacterium]
MTISFAEKKNVLLLASAQALFQTTSVMVMTLSGIVGMRLATDKGLATLPIALMVIGTALAMIPASMLMQRYGRKAGFIVGIFSGAMAGALGAYAIGIGSFWLFALANLLVGIYQACAQYYRFAAAEIASPDFKSRAISWTIAGGVVAALAGPNLARVTQSLGDTPFLFSFLAMVGLAIAAACVVSAIKIQKPAQTEQRGPQRTLFEIAKQRTFVTALASSMAGYMVMLGVMTATPLAMEICGQGFGAAATVIQWHVLGMFVPSFFTGSLIQRFGVHQVMMTGIALLFGHVLISIAGIDYLHFLSALILLGVGWNFLFIGGTTLLTEAYTPSERAKTQAMHDFIVFGAVSLASFSSGSLLNSVGWKTLNLMVIPLLVVALAGIGSHAWKLRTTAQLSS